MTRIVIVCFALAFIFGLQFSCSQRNEVNERINVMSSDVGGSLVFFFKRGTTDEQIFEFQRTVIGIPTQHTSGSASLPGIMTEVKVIVNGYDGESINFKPNATEEQKAFVKKRIAESPLIYKVYENVVPNLVKDL